MVEIAVCTANIITKPCDLLVLKHADGFYGVDALVSERIGFVSSVSEGRTALVSGKNIQAREVLFIGVGPLYDFRYEQIRAFAQTALEEASRVVGHIEIICMPVHGPGYGLDEREAFLSLIGGLLDAVDRGVYPPKLRLIEIIELNPKTSERLQNILSEVNKFGLKSGTVSQGSEPSYLTLDNVPPEIFASFGGRSEKKKKLFVAMPFAPEHSDVWEIAIQESCHIAGIMCERVDEQAYTGDILTQIKGRLQNGSGVLALLDDANPNVFLEVGFAWGMSKPTILIAKKGAKLPFDVQGQKCLHYTSIANLRALLTKELTGLKSQGVFD